MSSAEQTAALTDDKKVVPDLCIIFSSTTPLIHEFVEGAECTLIGLLDSRGCGVVFFGTAGL